MVQVPNAMDRSEKVRVNKAKSSCCVPHCTVTGYVTEDEQTVTFHCMPKDKELLKTWLVKIRRDEGPHFKVTKHTKICSRHFQKSDFLITQKGRRFLKDKAIPTIFSWTKDKQTAARSSRCSVSTPAQMETSETTVHVDDINLNVATEIDQGILQLSALQEKVKNLEAKVNILQKERDHFKNELIKLKEERKRAFCLDKFKGSDEDICFYTGFPSYDLMMECFEFLNPGQNGEEMNQVHTVPNSNVTPRQKKLDVKEIFFLVLIRLRLGIFEKHLAHMFDISASTVQRICVTWINFMYLRLGSTNIWPTKSVIEQTMPASMKEKYPNLTLIIDAFEIQCERPSSLLLASKSYSNYKSRNTVKGLIACTPSGQIGFISQLYTGSISDRDLTVKSGLLKLPHEKGSMWLVDKGFQIQDLCDQLGVKVNMPAFVGKNAQMTADEVFHTQQVASERIHVERAINKVKNFHIFDRPIPLSMLGTTNQTWTVCALLTLFQNPIISA